MAKFISIDRESAAPIGRIKASSTLVFTLLMLSACKTIAPTEREQREGERHDVEGFSDRLCGAHPIELTLDAGEAVEGLQQRCSVRIGEIFVDTFNPQERAYIEHEITEGGINDCFVRLDVKNTANFPITVSIAVYEKKEGKSCVPLS